MLYATCNVKGCGAAFEQKGYSQDIPVGWMEATVAVIEKDDDGPQLPTEGVEVVEVDIELDGRPVKLKVHKPEIAKREEERFRAMRKPRVIKVGMLLCPKHVPVMPDLDLGEEDHP